MRVSLNFLAIWSLGIALLFGVFDIARSVAQSRPLFMPFLQNLQDYLPEYLAAFSAFIKRNLSVSVWEHWFVPVLNMPGWLLFLVLSILFFIMGNIGRKSYAK
ncbi:hypothetical protein [Pseudochrobactrum kiredjianiae]|uniref:YggT family protein n=1 Tax=Pseudochrobactrum kiredjianiae TaxID=386305 RepID=A0ABW3UZD0_9HYPH|nr:hypothetical protein [Pseudochrobactrum kiredjianiae]MDM7852231.1 hypothetical protein [Pseudochrobactrum kiredjianiae]